MERRLPAPKKGTCFDYWNSGSCPRPNCRYVHVSPVAAMSAAAPHDNSNLTYSSTSASLPSSVPPAMQVKTQVWPSVPAHKLQTNVSPQATVSARVSPAMLAMLPPLVPAPLPLSPSRNATVNVKASAFEGQQFMRVASEQTTVAMNMYKRFVSTTSGEGQFFDFKATMYVLAMDRRGLEPMIRWALSMEQDAAKRSALEAALQDLRGGNQEQARALMEKRKLDDKFKFLCDLVCLHNAPGIGEGSVTVGYAKASYLVIGASEDRVRHTAFIIPPPHEALLQIDDLAEVARKLVASCIQPQPRIYMHFLEMGGQNVLLIEILRQNRPLKLDAARPLDKRNGWFMSRRGTSNVMLRPTYKPPSPTDRSNDATNYRFWVDEVEQHFGLDGGENQSIGKVSVNERTRIVEALGELRVVPPNPSARVLFLSIDEDWQVDAYDFDSLARVDWDIVFFVGGVFDPLGREAKWLVGGDPSRLIHCDLLDFAGSDRRFEEFGQVLSGHASLFVGVGEAIDNGDKRGGNAIQALLKWIFENRTSTSALIMTAFAGGSAMRMPIRTLCIGVMRALLTLHDEFECLIFTVYGDAQSQGLATRFHEGIFGSLSSAQQSGVLQCAVDWLDKPAVSVSGETHEPFGIRFCLLADLLAPIQRPLKSLSALSTADDGGQLCLPTTNGVRFKIPVSMVPKEYVTVLDCDLLTSFEDEFDAMIGEACDGDRNMDSLTFEFLRLREDYHRRQFREENADLARLHALHAFVIKRQLHAGIYVVRKEMKDVLESIRKHTVHARGLGEHEMSLYVTTVSGAGSTTLAWHTALEMATSIPVLMLHSLPPPKSDFFDSLQGLASKVDTLVLVVWDPAIDVDDSRADRDALSHLVSTRLNRFLFLRIDKWININALKNRSGLEPIHLPARMNAADLSAVRAQLDAVAKTQLRFSKSGVKELPFWGAVYFGNDDWSPIERFVRGCVDKLRDDDRALHLLLIAAVLQYSTRFALGVSDVLSRTICRVKTEKKSKEFFAQRPALMDLMVDAKGHYGLHSEMPRLCEFVAREVLQRMSLASELSKCWQVAGGQLIVREVMSHRGVRRGDPEFNEMRDAEFRALIAALFTERSLDNDDKSDQRYKSFSRYLQRAFTESFDETLVLLKDAAEVSLDASVWAVRSRASVECDRFQSLAESLVMTSSTMSRFPLLLSDDTRCMIETRIADCLRLLLRKFFGLIECRRFLEAKEMTEFFPDMPAFQEIMQDAMLSGADFLQPFAVKVFNRAFSTYDMQMARDDDFINVYAFSGQLKLLLEPIKRLVPILGGKDVFFAWQRLVNLCADRAENDQLLVERLGEPLKVAVDVWMRFAESLPHAIPLGTKDLDDTRLRSERIARDDFMSILSRFADPSLQANFQERDKVKETMRNMISSISKTRKHLVRGAFDYIKKVLPSHVLHFYPMSRLRREELLNMIQFTTNGNTAHPTFAHGHLALKYIRMWLHLASYDVRDDQKLTLLLQQAHEIDSKDMLVLRASALQCKAMKFWCGVLSFAAMCNADSASDAARHLHATEYFLKESFEFFSRKDSAIIRSSGLCYRQVAIRDVALPLAVLCPLSKEVKLDNESTRVIWLDGNDRHRSEKLRVFVGTLVDRVSGMATNLSSSENDDGRYRIVFRFPPIEQQLCVRVIKSAVRDALATINREVHFCLAFSPHNGAEVCFLKAAN